jgi:hypothetical protein
MKTVDKIKNTQSKLISDLALDRTRLSNNLKKLKKAEDVAKKKMEFFNTCVLYLESNPSVEFVEKQRVDVISKIENIEKEFNRLYDLSKNKEQFIKTKTFFLQDTWSDQAKGTVKIFKLYA